MLHCTYGILHTYTHTHAHVHTHTHTHYMFSLQWEDDELREFELLELAAADMSSQNSVMSHTHTPHNSISHTSHNPPATGQSQRLPSKHPADLSNLTSPTFQVQSQNVDSHFNEVQPEAEYSDSPLYFAGNQACYSTEDEDAPSFEGNNKLDETLKASTPPATSLAAGIDFNDEEVWESFSKPSPPGKLRGHHEPSDTETPDESTSESSTPLKQHLSDNENKESLTHFSVRASNSVDSVEHIHWTGQQQSRPSEHAQKVTSQKSAVLPRSSEASSLSREPSTVFQSCGESTDTSPDNHSSTGLPLSQHSNTFHPQGITRRSFHPHQDTDHQTQLSSSVAGQGYILSEDSNPHLDTAEPLVRPQLPPPSALISKLFPALRKEKVDSKKLTPLQVQGIAKDASIAIVKTPSPTMSLEGDSGKGSSLSSASSLLGDELRMKLCQLETEIERYRVENATLERLRREKEEVCVCVCVCVCESQR